MATEIGGMKTMTIPKTIKKPIDIIIDQENKKNTKRMVVGNKENKRGITDKKNFKSVTRITRRMLEGYVKLYDAKSIVTIGFNCVIVLIVIHTTNRLTGGNM